MLNLDFQLKNIKCLHLSYKITITMINAKLLTKFMLKIIHKNVVYNI